MAPVAALAAGASQGYASAMTKNEIIGLALVLAIFAIGCVAVFGFGILG